MLNESDVPPENLNLFEKLMKPATNEQIVDYNLSMTSIANTISKIILKDRAENCKACKDVLEISPFHHECMDISAPSYAEIDSLLWPLEYFVQINEEAKRIIRGIVMTHFL